MVPEGTDRVHLIGRRRVALFSWSMVSAELAGLQMALDRSPAAHIAILSGSCYPLAPLDAIDTMFESERGKSVFQLNEIPFPLWDSPWRADGGMWRFQHFFLTRGDNLLTIRGRPLPLWRRRIPRNLELYGAAQWKVYARSHAKALIDSLQDHPELLRFWRHSYNPDEACAASMLKSPAVVGDLSADVDSRGLWFIRWPAHDPTHPAWLTESDFDILETQARAGGHIFARKISSENTALLDRIDAELLA
jgi:hypothetical protein